SFVNCCIELCEGKEHVPPSTVQDAERKYADGRLRSLADEWRAEYPNLMAYAALIRGRLATFKYSEIAEQQFQEFMNDVFADLTDGDPVKRMISEYLENKRSMNSCLTQILKILYTTSIIGIKPQATDKVSWSYMEDKGVSEGQYKGSSSIHVHKMIWRALDIVLPPRAVSKGR
ncbi:MAG: ATPase, partial [Rhodoferax sp.]|nr:ATPase [Rhodoferax sp.]